MRIRRCTWNALSDLMHVALSRSRSRSELRPRMTGSSTRYCPKPAPRLFEFSRGQSLDNTALAMAGPKRWDRRWPKFACQHGRRVGCCPASNGHEQCAADASSLAAAQQEYSQAQNSPVSTAGEFAAASASCSAASQRYAPSASAAANASPSSAFASSSLQGQAQQFANAS